MISNAVNKLEAFQQDRNDMKLDADGMFVIVSGDAQCIQSYDKHKLHRLVVGDLCGASKYLLTQRFSYYGDIVAHNDTSKEELK